MGRAASKSRASGTARERHVALLRGINVGGKNLLPMAELAALFEAAGAHEVSTYIQSGNVLFSATAAGATKVVAQVEAALGERFERPMPVVLRSREELAAVVEANPFLARGAEPRFLYVAFLAQRPAAARVKQLDPERSPPDAFELLGRELFLQLPNGAGKTKLTNDYLDRTLDTVSTVRNWNTVTKLFALASG